MFLKYEVHSLCGKEKNAPRDTSLMENYFAIVNCCFEFAWQLRKNNYFLISARTDYAALRYLCAFASTQKVLVLILVSLIIILCFDLPSACNIQSAGPNTSLTWRV